MPPKRVARQNAGGGCADVAVAVGIAEAVGVKLSAGVAVLVGTVVVQVAVLL